MSKQTNVDPLQEAALPDPTAKAPLTAAAKKKQAAKKAAVEKEKAEVVKVAEAAPAPPSTLRDKYRVLRRITVSWGAQMVTLKPDQIVSEASHGAGCIERLRQAGVALEAVKK